MADQNEVPEGLGDARQRSEPLAMTRLLLQ